METMSTVSFSPFMDHDSEPTPQLRITEDILSKDIHHLVYSADLQKITQRSVFKRLEDKYGIKLNQFKAHIYDRAVEEARLRIQNTNPSPNPMDMHSHNNNSNPTNNQMDNNPHNLTQTMQTQYNNNTNYTNYSPQLQPQLHAHHKQRYYQIMNGTTNANNNNTSSSVSTVTSSQMSHHNNNVSPNNHHNSASSQSTMLRYQDIKKHYIGIRRQREYDCNSNASSTRSRSTSASYSDMDDNTNNDNENNGNINGNHMNNNNGYGNGNNRPKKKRRYNTSSTTMTHVHSDNRDNNQNNHNNAAQRKTAQSTREADKDTSFEYSNAFKQIMQRERGTWKDAWNWIMDYAKQNDLRIGTRKIKCDDTLKIAFDRDESSVSGVSRLIWKHLVGAVETDANGNFKKLKYKKRKKKDDGDGDNENGTTNGGYYDDDEKDGGDVTHSNHKNDKNNKKNGLTHSTNVDLVNNVEVRVKRRYRKRQRDENGNLIKKKKKSGLTRLCYMSKELKDLVGQEGPLQRNKITKAFWDYTQAQGLKKPGRIILCDVKLKAIWGDEIEQIHMYQVQKGLKSHIITMSKEEESKYKAEHAELFTDEEDNTTNNSKMVITKCAPNDLNMNNVLNVQLPPQLPLMPGIPQIPTMPVIDLPQNMSDLHGITSNEAIVVVNNGNMQITHINDDDRKEERQESPKGLMTSNNNNNMSAKNELKECSNMDTPTTQTDRNI